MPTYLPNPCVREQRNSVGMGAGLRDRTIGETMFDSREEVIFFSSRTHREALGTANFVLNVYRGNFQGVKRPGREADHSFATRAEVRMSGVVSDSRWQHAL